MIAKPSSISLYPFYIIIAAVVLFQLCAAGSAHRAWVGDFCINVPLGFIQTGRSREKKKEDMKEDKEVPLFSSQAALVMDYKNVFC